MCMGSLVVARTLSRHNRTHIQAHADRKQIKIECGEEKKGIMEKERGTEIDYWPLLNINKYVDRDIFL